MIRSTFSFLSFAAALLFVHGQAQAATTLSLVTRNFVSSGPDFHLSVVDGAAAYDNSGTTDPDQTWAFVNKAGV